MKYYGYAGLCLYINLTTNTIKKEPLDINFAKDFIGGFGINNRLAWDLIKSGTDPLSPENPVILGAGPLVGTLTPGATKTIATTRYPQTGAIASASGSMGFGANMKRAGYDHIIITGAAKKPVYIKIIDGDVEICDAGGLWGGDIHETTDQLMDDNNGGSAIAIGQGGENMVKYSLALIDKAASLGRGGLGAVFGSKKLKAVYIKGTGGIRPENQKKFLNIFKKVIEHIRGYQLHQKYIEYGAFATFDLFLPSLFSGREITPEKFKELYGPDGYKKFFKRRLACPSCAIGCKDIVGIKEEGRTRSFPIATFVNAGIVGHRLDLKDPDHALRLLDYLDRTGLDFLTVTALLDFLIGLYEKGIIKKTDIGGLELVRDYNHIRDLCEMIINKQGFGKILAEGWQETVRSLGKNFKQISAGKTYGLGVLKGLDWVLDPRESCLGTTEFDAVVFPRGAHIGAGISVTMVPGLKPDHLKKSMLGMGITEEAIERIFDDKGNINIGRFTRYTEDMYSLLCCLGLCGRQQNSRSYPSRVCAELYSCATGFKMEQDEIMKAAERSWTLMKMLNVQEGFNRKDDKVPEEWFRPIKVRGKELIMKDYFRKKPLTKADVDDFIEGYYDERGWDVEEGIPSKEKLKELSLDFVLNQ